MIREFIAQMKTEAKKSLDACISTIRKISSALFRFLFSASAIDVNAFIVLLGLNNAPGAGKRYRCKSGHAPIFSLYTFFALRP